MGKGQAILITGCAVTLVLFGTMCFLMTTVNPPPLPATQELNKHVPLLDEHKRVTLGPQSTNNDTKSSPLRTSQISSTQDAPGLRKDYVTDKYSIQRVVPPIWPIHPKTSSPINKTVGNPENRTLNETGKVGAKNTTSTLNDTLSVIKRSVNDVKQLGSDLNSIVLKIIDDSGQLNIEIKIGLNDAYVNKKNETRDDKIQPKDKSKYSIFLKRNNNNQFIKTKLAKNTIVSVMPNDFVTIDEYDDHLEEKNKIKNNMIQASIVDFNNSTKYNTKENKATVIPIYRDVLKPILIFYNQTKSIYHPNTKTKKNEKRDLLEKSNDADDGSKINHNRFKTANNTAYNETIQTEKGEKQIEKEDLLEKPNDTSDGYKTTVNSSKIANNTAYNLTTQTENGDLLEKPNDASDGCKTTVNSSKTANNTAYNLTTQTEKGDKQTEKGDLLEKPNDASDGCKTTVNSSKTANNTAYNLPTKTEKGDRKTEKLDLLEKPNDTSDGYKTNINSSKTTNNTTYNLTTRTEKTTLQCYVVPTRNKNITDEAENSTISTKTLDETSTLALVNSTIPFANGNSI